MTDQFDIAIIGAGIAGASIAAELASHARVLLAEGESTPGYHSTGRSAAFWDECYGGPGIVPLTLPSGEWLKEKGFLGKRGALYIGREQDLAQIDEFDRRFSGTGVSIERVGHAEMAALVPGLKPHWTHAFSSAGCADIDVSALHQYYLGLASRGGADLRTSHRLERATREAAGWLLEFANGTTIRAAILVNAAGAWADPVAQMCGARPLGIKPYRRSVAQLRVDPAADPQLPLVIDISGSFYFKPEGNRIWLSPHDETPTVPCDAAPEEIDIARAIDRLEDVVDWKVEVLERKWAGLRSFSPDRLPVYGHDLRCEGFFWFAGQGGFGIQTAPAAARLAAQLLLGQPRDAMTQPINADNYAPSRFG